MGAARLIAMGLNERANIVMVAIGPFFAMLISAEAAVRDIDSIHMEVAKSYRTGKKDLYRRVVVPAALPNVFGGLRISLGLALMGAIAVEFLVASNGLGYMIWHSWQILALDVSMAGLVATGIIGFVFLLAIEMISNLRRSSRSLRADGGRDLSA